MLAYYTCSYFWFRSRAQQHKTRSARRYRTSRQKTNRHWCRWLWFRVYILGRAQKDIRSVTAIVERWSPLGWYYEGIHGGEGIPLHRLITKPDLRLDWVLNQTTDNVAYPALVLFDNVAYPNHHHIATTTTPYDSTIYVVFRQLVFDKIHWLCIAQQRYKSRRTDLQPTFFRRQQRG